LFRQIKSGRKPIKHAPPPISVIELPAAFFNEDFDLILTVVINPPTAFIFHSDPASNAVFSGQ